MSRGMKFATIVGIPMPRFTSIPLRNSWAIRFAMTVWASISSPVCNEIINQRSWGKDVVGRDKSDGNDMLGCDNGGARRHGDDRIEITCGQGIGAVAKIVGKKCANQGEICVQRRLDQISLTVRFDPLFAFLDDRADARPRPYTPSTLSPRPAFL